MSEPTRVQDPGDPQDLHLRRSWWILASAFVLLALFVLARLADRPEAGDWLLAALVLLVAATGARHWTAVRALEGGRRTEAESFAGILQALSRSVSPDSIVAAIVEELTAATAADHVVVVRRRPGARILEATLVSSRPGVPSSSTLLPISDLEDPVSRRVAPPGERTAVGLPVAVTQPAVVGRGAGLDAGASSAELPHPVGGPARDRRDRRSSSVPVPPATAVSSLRALGRRVLASDLVPAAARGLRHSESAVIPGHAELVAERIATRVRDVYGLKHSLTAPLRANGELVGAIVVSRRTAVEWPPSTRRLLAGAAIEASAALSRAYSHREAEARASTDALTGLPNRRYFDEFCGLLARRRRAGDAVGVLMIDIDRFKGLNDSLGHAVGDEVLRAVGAAIASAVREEDVPARYGGEEFAVLLRNPAPEVAVEVGERVRRAVRALDLRRHGVARVTVSVGVAVASVPDEPIPDLLARADRALYEAKRAGRDRVVAG